MGVTLLQFEKFEQELLKLMQEFQTISASESHLREALRTEAMRAETAEAGQASAERAAAEARSSAAGAAAALTQATASLAKAQDELAATKMQFELADNHRAVLEQKCSEMSNELDNLKRELQKLKPLQSAQAALQRQYSELQERIYNATSEARKEAARLENELRRVEKSASGGTEIRERARLAAAAHVRERRLAAAELQHTSHELNNAKNEITNLRALVAELQCRLADRGKGDDNMANNIIACNEEALSEARAALEAERTGTARLEKALAAALADNAALATKLHDTDNVVPSQQNQEESALLTGANICPIDSFLAE